MVPPHIFDQIYSCIINRLSPHYLAFADGKYFGIVAFIQVEFEFLFP